MENRIELALSKLFKSHRIVFWYDTKKELREGFEALDLTAVTKVELANNEFGLKYRLLREEKQQKFLLYCEGAQPADLDNWLLDVQLAHAEFRTDQVALWLGELELGIEFADLVQSHEEFFKASKRKNSLKKILKPTDTENNIRMKMLAVCAGSNPRLDNIIESLLEELSEQRDDKAKLIERCKLDAMLWDKMQRHYSYQSDTPGIQDFVIELFKSCFAMSTEGQLLLSTDALVFLRRWKDSRQYEGSFEKLSAECADVLGIEQALNSMDFRTLMEVDYFKLIDQKIISDLVQMVSERTVSPGEVANWVRQRRQGHWYKEFKHLYEAIDYAVQFVHLLDETVLEMETMLDGIERYTQSWFRLDQLYRKFTWHVRRSRLTSLMETLSVQVENLYSNNYLLKLNDRWQEHVNALSHWQAPPIRLQKDFFEHYVRPFLNKGKKVYVIISDALRYEIGDELLSLIRQEDRFDASLKPMLSMLPSYTALGMAALLPNKELTLTEKSSADVLVDGISSMGTANRIKILQQGIEQRGTAILAKDFMNLNRDDCRSLVREHDVIYIYHNLIDKTGDSRDTEERVFDATEETLTEMIKLIKKLAGANASNMLLTADHGFIYQNNALDESDFSSAEVEGEEVFKLNRRFVLGKGLKQLPELRTFKASELGLAGNVEIQIPKSINRLRVRGSGSRFVHGGAALQEIVIPVIQINKKRKSDISVVEVDILRGGTTVITSGQLALMFYQREAATDKIQARKLRAGIYTQDGELISDSHDLVFDFISENTREREIQVRFVLSRSADEANGQDVILRLDEKLTGTSHYKEYKTLTYTIRRSFTSDFDF